MLRSFDGEIIGGFVALNFFFYMKIVNFFYCSLLEQENFEKVKFTNLINGII